MQRKERTGGGGGRAVPIPISFSNAANSALLICTRGNTQASLSNSTLSNSTAVFHALLICTRGQTQAGLSNSTWQHPGRLEQLSLEQLNCRVSRAADLHARPDTGWIQKPGAKRGRQYHIIEESGRGRGREREGEKEGESRATEGEGEGGNTHAGVSNSARGTAGSREGLGTMKSDSAQGRNRNQTPHDSLIAAMDVTTFGY